MSSDSKNSRSGFAEACITVSKFLFGVLTTGILRRETFSRKHMYSWSIVLTWLLLVAYAPKWNFAKTLALLFPNSNFGLWLGSHIPRGIQVGVLFGSLFCTWLFVRGFKDWFERSQVQKMIDHLGLKTPTGLTPQVTRVIPMENGQRRILVKAVGIDVQTFKDKRGALESSLNGIVQNVSTSATNRQTVELLVADRELPKEITFESEVQRLSAPFTFLVGQTFDKFITADLQEIHHLLIAGATGGGKSVFFKQTLIGLLKSSQYIQLYLIDLKRGVELGTFASLENVEIAKEEGAAVSLLQVIVAEMDRRFELLEKSGFTEINPSRDRLDRIVVAIDEASVLFTVGKASKDEKNRALSARDLTDKIAKLGRAAGIHLILATQKVVKETIDTRVQTNINAKICFRVNTIASSMTVLNNKKAAELPDIKGRAIWSVGSNDSIVQVPKMLSDQVNEEIDALALKFNGQASPLYQPMLKPMTPVKKENESPHGEFNVAGEKI